MRNAPLIIIFLIVSSHNQDKNYHLVYSFAYSLCTHTFTFGLHCFVPKLMWQIAWKCWCATLISILLGSLPFYCYWWSVFLCMRIRSSSKISELLSLKSRFFQGLCLGVRLMIQSLGSDHLQDSGENRHGLDFKLPRVRDRTMSTFMSPLPCMHQWQTSYTV